MVPIVLLKNDQEERTTQPRSKKFSRLLIIIGILLLLNICYASAVNGTDVNNLPPPQTLNVTPVPVIQTLNVTTMLPTQTQQAPAVVTTTPVAKKATTVSHAAKVTAANSPQFKLIMSKEITQADKEAAAENYRKIREAYLTQGSPGAANVMGYSISAAPIMDPGGSAALFRPVPQLGQQPHAKRYNHQYYR